MKKHIFTDTEVVTSYGDIVQVPLCENCGAPEFDRGPCNEYLSMVQGNEEYLEQYLEKALKAVARV